MVNPWNTANKEEEDPDVAREGLEMDNAEFDQWDWFIAERGAVVNMFLAELAWCISLSDLRWSELHK